MTKFPKLLRIRNEIVRIMNHQLKPIKITAPGKPFLSMLAVTPSAFDSLMITDR